MNFQQIKFSKGDNMKIYNEITTIYNEETGQWETVSEDSYDYNGPMDLAQGDDDYFSQYGTELPEDWEIEELSAQQLAQLGQDTTAISNMLSQLGISNASGHTQYIDQYDPTLQNLNLQQYKEGLDESRLSLQKSLLDSIGQPSNIDVSGAEATGGGGSAWTSAVMPALSDTNIQMAENQFLTNRDAAELDLRSRNEKLFENWSQQFYNQAGNIYAQQNQPSGGGGKK